MSLIAPQLPGLELLEEVGRGARNLVYRARRRGRLVAVKVPRMRGALDSVYQEYRCEASLQARVSGVGLPEVYEVGCHQGLPFMVQEFLEGVTLCEALKRGPYGEEASLALLQDLARTLAVVHERGLVHRDIKPANILIGHSGQARLIDFGLATRSHLGKDASLTGTFRYSAPEQTGMLERPLDGRADLYSLGVVLYECLSGRPPFLEEDAAELIRLHAVAPPPDLAGLAPQVSPLLVAAVQRLLAKDPDDRFASAAHLLSHFGLEHSSGKDRAARLVGRHSELTVLAEHWQAVQRGQGRMLLISGDGGSGKSVLAAEFARQRKSRNPEVRVVGAKCDPARVPFGLLRDLIERVVSHLDRAAEPERSAAMAEIKRSVGGSGPLLARFSPRLGDLMGVPQMVVEGADDSHARFFLALSGFLLAVARQFTMVVIVDDLQWIDQSSQQVLRRLAEGLGGTRCLLLATSREETWSGFDLPASHRLALQPLNSEEMGQLLSATLGGTSDPRLLDQLCLASNGNPFAAVASLEAALDAGLFVPHWGSWRAEGEGMAQLELPGDVISMVVHRLDHLSPAQRQVLQSAAVLGLRFDAEQLAQVASEQYFPILAEAIRLKLVEKLDAGCYRFVHDRVREALLDGLSHQALCQLHARAGEAIGDSDLFRCAEHLWMSTGCEPDPKTSQANLRAGMLAVSQLAYQEAYRFFQRAWQTRPEGVEISAEMSEAFGEACFVTGRFEESMGHLRKAVADYRDGLRRAQVCARIAQVHLVEVDAESAWEVIKTGLSELGIQLCSGVFSRLRLLLSEVAARLQRPVVQVGCEKTQVEVRLYQVATTICFFDAKIPEFVEVVVRGLRVARSLGPSPALTGFYSMYGVFLAGIGLHKASRKYRQRALAMAEQLGDPAALAQTEVYRALAARAAGDDHEAAQISQQSLSQRGAWLGTFDYMLSCLDLTHNLHFRGLLGQAEEWALTSVRRVNEDHFPMFLTSTMAAVYSAVGRHGEAHQQQQICRAAFEKSVSPLRRSMYLISTAHAYFERGELGSEIDRLFQEFHQLGFHPFNAPYHIRACYILEGHVRYRQCLGDPARIGEFEKALARLRVTPHFNLVRTHHLVLQAGYHRLRGNLRRCRQLLVQAEEQAQRSHNAWVRIEVAKIRAQLLRDQGLPEAAALEAGVAVAIANEIGWLSQVHRIESDFSLSLKSRTSLSRESAPRSATTVRLQRNMKALLEVTLASARVLDAGELSQLVLGELVRILGAERAFLFLTENSNLSYQAGVDSQGLALPSPRDHASSVVDRVLSTQRAVLVSGNPEGQFSSSESVVTHDLRSILAAPLLLRDKLLGVVYLDSRLARGVFAQEDVEVLQALANQIAVSLETARAARLEVQVRSEREQRHLAEQLGDMVGTLLSHLDSEQVLTHLLEGLHKVVGFEAGYALMLKDGLLTPAVVKGEPTTLPSPCLPEGLWAEVIRGTRPLLLEGGHWLSASLHTAMGPLGSVTLERDPAQPFGRADVELLQTFAGYASVAVENAQLFANVERLATTDELTGILNRRQFLHQASDEFQRADRIGHDLSLVMFDVDHFKKFNDTYGHAIGDLVLRTVAGRCRDCLRGIDHLGRLGGEEFAVLFVGTALEPGRLTADRLRCAIANTPFESSQGPLSVAISLGVAQRRPKESLDEVLERADEALYRAKRGGRNRVELA